MFRHPLIQLSDLSDTPKKIDFFGRTILVSRVGERVVAFADSCSHLGGPLEFKAGQYVCSWHGACFDEAGHRVSGPAPVKSRLMALPIEVVDGRVEYVWKG